MAPQAQHGSLRSTLPRNKTGLSSTLGGTVNGNGGNSPKPLPTQSTPANTERRSLLFSVGPEEPDFLTEFTLFQKGLTFEAVTTPNTRAFLRGYDKVFLRIDLIGVHISTTQQKNTEFDHFELESIVKYSYNRSKETFMFCFMDRDGLLREYRFACDKYFDIFDAVGRSIAIVIKIKNQQADPPSSVTGGTLPKFGTDSNEKGGNGGGGGLGSRKNLNLAVVVEDLESSLNGGKRDKERGKDKDKDKEDWKRVLTPSTPPFSRGKLKDKEDAPTPSSATTTASMGSGTPKSNRFSTLLRARKSSERLNKRASLDTLKSVFSSTAKTPTTNAASPMLTRLKGSSADSLPRLDTANAESVAALSELRKDTIWGGVDAENSNVGSTDNLNTPPSVTANADGTRDDALSPPTSKRGGGRAITADVSETTKKKSNIAKFYIETRYAGGGGAAGPNSSSSSSIGPASGRRRWSQQYKGSSEDASMSSSDSIPPSKSGEKKGRLSGMGPTLDSFRAISDPSLLESFDTPSASTSLNRHSRAATTPSATLASEPSLADEASEKDAKKHKKRGSFLGSLSISTTSSTKKEHSPSTPSPSSTLSHNHTRSSTAPLPSSTSLRSTPKSKSADVLNTTTESRETHKSRAQRVRGTILALFGSATLLSHGGKSSSGISLRRKGSKGSKGGSAASVGPKALDGSMGDGREGVSPTGSGNVGPPLERGREKEKEGKKKDKKGREKSKDKFATYNGRERSKSREKMGSEGVAGEEESGYGTLGIRKMMPGMKKTKRAAVTPSPSGKESSVSATSEGSLSSAGGRGGGARSMECANGEDVNPVVKSFDPNGKEVLIKNWRGEGYEITAGTVEALVDALVDEP
ncbi:hypothetical protein HK102_004515, partial [Quaeritorhiza haematococci]